MPPASDPRLPFEWVDPTIDPRDDLYGHVNGRYLKEHELPRGWERDGAFGGLVKSVEEQLKNAVVKATAESGHQGVLVKAMYESFMNTEAIEAKGAAPFSEIARAIDKAADKAALATVLGTLQRSGLVNLFKIEVLPDGEDSSRYLMHLTQGGLGMPGEEFYTDPENQPIADAYAQYQRDLARTLDISDPHYFADRAVSIERAIANVSWDSGETRDVEASYNLRTRSQLESDAPNFPWEEWATAYGADSKAMSEVVVMQPSFLTEVDAMWANRSLEDLKAWLTMQAADSVAPYLTAEISDLHFGFHETTLNGVNERDDRWRYAIKTTNAVLDNAVGKLYAEEAFPESSKQAVLEMIDNIVAAYREQLPLLEWMSEETKAEANRKLDNLVVKVGFPDEWREYEGVALDSDDLVGNITTARAHNTDHMLDKLTRPVNRHEWEMPPQEVNAACDPQTISLEFTAAFLQAPFFSSEADIAYNYGAIGTVIAHELGHLFDDQGSRYDFEGNKKDTWPAADRAAYEAMVEKSIEQLNASSPYGLPDHKVKGAKAVGEFMADATGESIAHRALEIKLGGKLNTRVGTYTRNQIFFMANAAIFREKATPEFVIKRIAAAENPHAPTNVRTNLSASNTQSFHDAYGVRPEHGMYRAPADRVVLWEPPAVGRTVGANRGL